MKKQFKSKEEYEAFIEELKAMWEWGEEQDSYSLEEEMEKIKLINKLISDVKEIKESVDSIKQDTTKIKMAVGVDIEQSLVKQTLLGRVSNIEENMLTKESLGDSLNTFVTSPNFSNALKVAITESFKSEKLATEDNVDKTIKAEVGEIKGLIKGFGGLGALIGVLIAVLTYLK